MVNLSVRAIRSPEFTRGVLPLQSNKGAPMPLDFRTAASTGSADDTGVEAQDEMRERVVTALATSLAVMIVAGIAVLMAMA
jgi:hypothetical protein